MHAPFCPAVAALLQRFRIRHALLTGFIICLLIDLRAAYVQDEEPPTPEMGQRSVWAFVVVAALTAIMCVRGSFIGLPA